MIPAAASASRACCTCGALYATDALFCPLDGTPLTDPHRVVEADPYLDLEIAGHIRLEKLAGVGAMGRVYKAFQKGIDRDVAVKVLHRELSSNTQLVGRFLREAKVASRLTHPGVVHVLLSGQMPDGALYIAMEYLDGISLGAAMAAAASANGALPIARAIHIALQLAEAVGEAHAQGVVHRDLKPENVMLVRRGDDPDYVKVLDFGIARVSWTDPSTTTQAGLIFGTARYISPEGAEGKQVGPAGDVYALATLLYQMLAGRTPFVGEQAVGLLVQQIHDAPPDLRSIGAGKGVPDPIAEVVMKNLAKAPEARAAEARAFGQELAAAAEEAGFDVPSPSARSLRSGASRASRPSFLSSVPTNATVKWGKEALGLPRTVIATEIATPSVDPTLDDATPPPPPSLRGVGAVVDRLSEPGDAPSFPAPSRARPGGTEIGDDVASLPPPIATPLPTPISPNRSSVAPSPRAESGRGARTFGIVVVCFLLGAGLVVFAAFKMGRIGPEAGRAELLQKTRAAAAERRWIEPPGNNVKDLTHEGLRRWPADPELTGLRDQAADALATNALESRRGGDVREAARLAKLAHELAPSDASKTHLFEQYNAELGTSTESPVPALPPADAKKLPPPSSGSNRQAAGVRVFLDLSTASPRLGQPVSFSAKVLPNKAKVEEPAFTVEGPGLPSPASLTAAGDGVVFSAAYTFLEPGKYKVTFSARADGSSISAVREIVVGGAPRPGPNQATSNAPVTPAPSASVKWM